MRRRFIRLLLIPSLAFLVLAAGCSEPSATTTSLDDGGVEVTPSTTPHVTPDGVVLRVAAAPFTNLDPAAASSTGDILLLHQVYDWLVEDGETGALNAGLALSWEETGPAVWTLKLRPNVIFHDGDPFDADDVVHTFERLARLARSTARGTTLADFGVIDTVIAVDGRTVRFVLTRPDPEFPALLARDAAAVLSNNVDDPSREWVGTGPFVLWSYGPDKGAVLRKNPAYWMTDASNNHLPYLDGIDIAFDVDPSGHVDGLLAGDLDFVGGLTVAESDRVSGNPGSVVLDSVSNEHLSIDVLVDEGRPGADPRVLRALKVGTDRTALTAALRAALGEPGNDSPVGPLYGALHLDFVPGYDPDSARALLAEAGFGEGLTLTLALPDDEEAAALAELWGGQLQLVGVTVEIGDARSYADAGTSADMTITRWLSEPRPSDYFARGYGSGSVPPGSGWVDEEFQRVMARLAEESEPETRIALYHDAQTILADRGPVIVPFYEHAVAGADVNLLGVAVAPYWPRTSFRAASFGN